MTRRRVSLLTAQRLALEGPLPCGRTDEGPVVGRRAARRVRHARPKTKTIAAITTVTPSIAMSHAGAGQRPRASPSGGRSEAWSRFTDGSSLHARGEMNREAERRGGFLWLRRLSIGGRSRRQSRDEAHPNLAPR